MISVCMATYNGAKYIKEQIESILIQLSNEDEIIVSDDGSTDNTLDIIRSLNDDRIKILNHTPISGPPIMKAKANFENALSNCNGDYIFMADQDDVWEINKVKTILPYLKNIYCIQHGKKELASDREYNNNSLRRHHSLLSGILSMHFAGCCMAVTKDFLQKALPIPACVQSHDGWFACLAISMNQYQYIPDCLIKHRLHDCNASVGVKNSLFFKIRYRLQLYREIIKRRSLCK